MMKNTFPLSNWLGIVLLVATLVLIGLTFWLNWGLHNRIALINGSEHTAILNPLYVLAVVVAFALGGAVVMVYTDNCYVIHPINQSCIKAKKVETRPSEGTLEQGVRGFEKETATLRALYRGLEAQVAVKTRRIAAQKEQLDALYQISAFLAGPNTLQEISRGFACRVRVLMKADALAVRWGANNNQKSHILSSANFPLEMLEKEKCLLSGACACGSMNNNSSIRVIPIKNTDIAPLQYCSKYGYKTLISIPVKLKNKILGEINLFYRHGKVLTAEDLELINALANHLANTVEGMKTIALDKEAAISKERTMLARELHDSTAQSLAFLKIQFRLLRSFLAKKDEASTAKVMDELDNGLQESIADVRELLLHFRTRTRDDEIEVAVQETLQKFHHQTGLSVSWKVMGEGLPLPQDVQVHVLHVLQESLSNIRKHAAASHVSIIIAKGGSWQFEVCDDGVGFDPEIKRGQLQVGLKIMQERAVQIGAQVELHSKIGEGTSVILHVPSVQSGNTESVEQESKAALI